jgi:hypothetical protein
MGISSNCNCKYKAYVLACCRCGKTATLCETDTKEKQLIEMKKRLEKLIIEKTVLRMEIRELENEIFSDKEDDEIAEAVKDFLTS